MGRLYEIGHTHSRCVPGIGRTVIAVCAGRRGISHIFKFPLRQNANSECQRFGQLAAGIPGTGLYAETAAGNG